MTAVTPFEADTIDAAELARNVRRGWPIVLAGMVGGLLVAAAVIAFVPARFAATTSIVVHAQDQTTSSLASRLGGSLAGAAAAMLPGGITASPIETEIQVLSSRSLAGEAVDSLLLQARIHSATRLAPWQVFQTISFPGSFKRRTYHFQRTAGAPTYTVSGGGAPVQATPGVPASIDQGRIVLSTATLPPAFDVDVYDREEAIDRFQKREGTSKVGGEVLAIAYQGDDSLTAAAAPNLMVRRYLNGRKITDRGINERRVEFLTLEVDSLEAALRAAENALRAQQEASGVLDPVVVGKLELERAGELRKERATLDVERGALDQLLTKLHSGDLTPRQLAAFPAFLRSPGINELLAQLSTLETKRLQLLATLTPEDPAVIAATEGIKNIEAQLPAYAQTYVTTLDRERTDIGRQLDTLRSAIERLPATGEEALRRQREVLRLSTINAAVRAQLVEAKLGAIGEGGDVRLLDVASPPRKISFPRPMPTLAAGLGGGLVLGLVLAMFSGFYGRYVSDVRSIERQLGVPALAFDPRLPFLVSNPADARALLLVPLDANGDTSGVAERLMRTASSRGLRATIVDLSRASSATNGRPDIDALGAEFDLVVVRLPDLATDATVGELRETRPVLFVATAGRVDRRRLTAAVESLQRMSIPCAGVVLSRQRTPALLES